MALGMIPNPKKTVVIDFSIADIKHEIIKIPSQFDKNYNLDKQNDLLNQFTFSALEFLSLGVYIDINLNYVTESKTSIEIEVRRKIGAFDKAFEVQKANQHIQKLLTGISTLLTKQKQNAVSVDAENPIQEIKFNLPIQDVRRQLNTFLKTYSTVYKEDIDNSTEAFAILRRHPQKADDVYLEIDAIIKLFVVNTNDSSTHLKLEVSNDNNKISTQGELNRNILILKITIKLINKIVTDLEASIQKAEQELGNIQKWKIGRSEAVKQQQIDAQLLVIDNLKKQLRQD
jgi:hypothetical protein